MLGSGMVGCGDLPDGFDEHGPSRAAVAEDLAAGGGEPVETLAALAVLLHPPALDVPAVLQTINQRIARGHAEAYGATRAGFDLLADFVAMALPGFEQGEHEQLRAALLEIPVDGLVGHRLSNNIC